MQFPQAAATSLDFAFAYLRTWKLAQATPITLRAVVNYRRFVQEYADYVLKRQNRKLTLPIVQMAESEVKIIPVSPKQSAKSRAAAKQSRDLQALRWNDYGIALLEQAQYGPAADAFRRAGKLNPTDLNRWSARPLPK